MGIYPPKEYYSTLSSKYAQTNKPTFIFSLTEVVWWKWLIIWLGCTFLLIGYDLLLKLKVISPILPLGHFDIMRYVLFGILVGISVGILQKSTMIILGKNSWIIVTLGFFGKEKKTEIIPLKEVAEVSLKKKWIGWSYSLSRKDGRKMCYSTTDHAWRFHEQKKAIQEIRTFIEKKTGK
jgi:hypothetical protein